MKYKELKTIFWTVSDPQAGMSCCDPFAIAKLLIDRIGDDEREHFIVYMLDLKNKIKSSYVVSIGTISECMVHPREVFRAAIACGVSSIAVAHNHPSGTVSASKEDIATTKLLIDAGKLLGIPCLDHVVVGTAGSFYSMREHQAECHLNFQ